MSSSLEFQVIATDPGCIQGQGEIRLCRGQVERSGGEAIISAQNEDAARQKFTPG